MCRFIFGLQWISYFIKQEFAFVECDFCTEGQLPFLVTLNLRVLIFFFQVIKPEGLLSHLTACHCNIDFQVYFFNTWLSSEI